MAYYINQIENNVYNKYKYQYLDHIVGTIDLRQNYWDFNIQLLMINNCLLPLNVLLSTLSLPYQEIKNITFNLASDQSQASKMVSHNIKYAKIYESKFSVDISNNQYLKQDLNNVILDCLLSLEVDPEPIIKSKAQISQEALDGYILETQEQKWDYKMYYTNTHLIDSSSVIYNTYGYSIKEHNAIPKLRLVNCKLDNYLINEQSIINLFQIQSTQMFKVLEAKVKFHYWLDLDTNEKTLESNLVVSQDYCNDINISFNKFTSFDYTKNEVVINQTGVNGFYIPKKSQGYYQLELKVAQDTDVFKMIVKNDFIFNQQFNKPHIDISNTTIKDVKGWEVIKW